MTADNPAPLSEIQISTARVSNGIVALSEFAKNEIAPMLMTAKPVGLSDDAHATVFGLFGRCSAWLSTMATLIRHGDGRSDFQAYQSAARALMELTVDLALLANDSTQHTRLEAWERSSKLKHAECAARYLRTDGRRREGFDGAFDFLEREGEAIRAERHLWPESKHPQRWTGNNLLEDARAADRYAKGLRVEEFYETQYRYLCWNVHGSTIAGIRGFGADGADAICGISFHLCGHFGVCCAELALRGVSWPPSSAATLQRMQLEFYCAYAGVRLRTDVRSGIQYFEPLDAPQQP